MGSFGCIRRVLITRWNLPWAVWFIKHRSSLWGQDLCVVDFYLLSLTPATYDINRRLPPCRQLSGRPRRPRPGSPASLEEVNWSLFVCLLCCDLVSFTDDLAWFGRCDCFLHHYESSDYHQLKYEPSSTQSCGIQWPSHLVKYTREEKEDNFQPRNKKQVWNIVFPTQTVVKLKRINPEIAIN